MGRIRRMRNRGRRGGSGGGGNNRWATIMQILVLVGALVFIFVFRDDIARSASSILGGFDDKGDIEVEKEASGGGTQDKAKGED